MEELEFARQMILFGPPGCGKSYRVRIMAEDLDVVDADGDPEKSPNMIETTFHPEYGYGDFVAKLLPQTKEIDGKNHIEYRIHAGPVIKALARAYANQNQNVLVVIDEINRGNCAQIFGDIFQLLDRNEEGWSEYGINPNDLIMGALIQELSSHGKKLEDLPEELRIDEGAGYKLRLPPNLFVIGTMNTSDESVYYMDTAFKRRWDFEYMPWDGMDTPEAQTQAKIEITEHAWHDFLSKLNAFIAAEFSGRNVDDKQIGVWFLKVPRMGKKPELEELKSKLEQLKGKSLKDEWEKHFKGVSEVDGMASVSHKGNLRTASIAPCIKNEYKIDCSSVLNNIKSKPEKLAETLISYIDEKYKFELTRSSIQNKLMFFLWDNVFSRDRRPLHKLLTDGGSTEEIPRTFGDFARNVDAFITGVMVAKHEVAEASD